MDYLNTIFEATEFIHRNPDENILVSDIAEYVYLSSSYFSMVFRIITGYTVKEYVNQYRLYQAAKALKETDKRIISIAFESGFSSQQSLTKKFVRQYKISPAHFRKINPPFSSREFIYGKRYNYGFKTMLRKRKVCHKRKLPSGRN